MARKANRAGMKPVGIWTSQEIKDKAQKINQKLSGSSTVSAGFNYSVNKIYSEMFEKK